VEDGSHSEVKYSELPEKQINKVRLLLFLSLFDYRENHRPDPKQFIFKLLQLYLHTRM